MYKLWRTKVESGDNPPPSTSTSSATSTGPPKSPDLKTLKNDSSDPQWKRTDYPHSKAAFEALQSVFGLTKFNPNQLEAINATMLGHDCLVLMPTGSGKSLCFQLPAVISNGVTIVISPLRALINDQVKKLREKEVNVQYLTGETERSEQQMILSDLRSDQPKIKLLYTTPEKIFRSPIGLMNIFRIMYAKRTLSRVVVDEAHCLSFWGHDFRTDYCLIKEFKNISKSLPVFAATATATPLVRADIIRQLNLQDPKQFVLSFNRPNLSFEIINKKGIKFVPYICSLLKEEFQGQTGIIYRRERKQCERLAEELTNAGFKVAYYHAELPQDVRRRVQHQWLTGEVLVVIATIAFGMGIDKPDVRFIIHGELTNSIEQYLQECGRAGRDGKPSHCILFFSFGDMMDLEEIICNSPTRNIYYLKVHLSNLAQMVYYAINYTECRRLQFLRYFGEDFDPSECANNPYTSCDVCLFKPSIENKDMTSLAKEVVSWMKNFKGFPRGQSRLMVYGLMSNFAGIYKKKGEPFPETLPVAGKGKHLGQKDAERFIIKLLAEGFLREDQEMSFFGCHMVTYIGVGPRADELINDQATFSMPVIIRKTRKDGDIKPKFKKEDPEESDKLLNLEMKCYCQLVMLTAEIAEGLKMKFCHFLPLQSLRDMAASLPIDEESLLKIDHVTQVFCSKYGQRYLKILQEFAEEKEKLMTTTESHEKKPQPSESSSKPPRQRRTRTAAASSKESEPAPGQSNATTSKRPRARRTRTKDSQP